MGPALKDCLMSPYLYQSDLSKGYMEGVRCLMQYYRWIELNAKNYENYVMQRSQGIQVTKIFKNSEITSETFQQLTEEIKSL